MPKINPTIMAWARKSAGLSIEDAADKIGLHASRGISGAERLLALEEGTQLPTRQILLKMSKQYRRPLLAFYMSAAPRTGDRGDDFRTLPQQQAGQTNVLVDTLIRDVRARQSMVRSVLEDAGEAHPLPFIASAKLGDSVDNLAQSISERIGVSAQQYQAAQSPDEGFAALRAGAEGVGVFVILAGNLGSHHTAIDVEAFRGFALADEIAPFVVVNDQDAKTAWAFTLVHELAHLWLGATGVSGLYAESQLERYCNDVASELLLPRQQLGNLQVTPTSTFEELRERIREFSSARNLSSTMVAYRLQKTNLIEWRMWERLRDFFRDQWISSRERARAQAREQKGGPN
jgi:Zn-dependent peptidase ImmA (M78 family)/transcriptional regulator with XRE-family HTH domain